MASPAPDPATWGSCQYCGVAVPPGAGHCEICGADGPVRAGALATAPKSVRRRIQWTAWLRTVIVLGVAVGLAYTIVDAEITGPPSAGDPLTTAGIYTIPVGTVHVLAGNVTGGDYVIGNFTTIRPGGLSLSLAVYNASNWHRLVNGSSVAPAWSMPAQPDGRIIFVAQYTDLYYFVFSNPYPVGSTLNVTAYITTEYESNVGDEGFG